MGKKGEERRIKCGRRVRRIKCGRRVRRIKWGRRVRRGELNVEDG